MVEFEKALKKLLIHEGAYSNNPNDNGGETFCGISRRWFPRWAGWPMVDSVEDKTSLMGIPGLQDAVGGFYYSYFWHKIKCDGVNDSLIAEMLFITSVNVGKKVAIKKMQRILKVKADGLVGNITLGALNSMDVDKFVYQFTLEMVDFYMQVSAKGNNHLFLKGWLNRAMSFYYASLNRS